MRKEPPLLTMQAVLAWIYLYPVRGIAAVLPVNFIIRLADWLAPVYAACRPGLRAQTGQRMGRSLDAGDPEQSAANRNTAKLASDWLKQDLKKNVDDLLLQRFDMTCLDAVATVEGLEHLTEALEGGKGAIVISGHFHANRLAKYYLRRKGFSLMSIRNRNPANMRMGKLGNRFVSPAYGRYLERNVEDELHTQDPGLGAGILRRLRENGIVNFHVDATLSREWVAMHYLNEKRRFPTGFLRLAEMTGTPLVPMLCRGDSRGFQLRFQPPVRYTDRSSPEDFQQRLHSWVAIVETWIREYPDQWELWPREEGQVE